MSDDTVADANEAQWQYLLAHARNAGWSEYQALVEAAYAEPQLRRLYPDMQYWMLFFADSSQGLFLARKNVCLEAPSDLNCGQYTLRASWQSPPLAQAATAAEIIALTIQHLG